MNVKLVVVQGKPEGKEIPLRAPKFLIGRGTECHLRPNSELISRHHCLFVIDQDRVILRDLGSTNGTLVNGERLQGETTIYHEDMIQVGPLGFRVVVDAAAPAAIEPVPEAAPAEAVAASARSKVGALGGKDTNEGEIERWLVTEGKGPRPGGESEIFESDSELQNTKIELAQGQDTQHDLQVAPDSAEAPQAAPGEVTLESGRTVKIGNARSVIEKTREDTSRAAADILRRMMDRRTRS